MLEHSTCCGTGVCRLHDANIGEYCHHPGFNDTVTWLKRQVLQGLHLCPNRKELCDDKTPPEGHPTPTVTTARGH